MLRLLLAAFAAFAVDQLSKSLAARHPGLDAIWPRWEGARIRPVLQQGAWLVEPRSPRFETVWWGAACIATAAIASWLDSPGVELGFGVALGGAAGNLFDRRRRGAILDFLDLRLGGVFNLADVAIVAGIGVAVLAVFLER